jgi:AcrR family transcriptional regulator
MARISREQQEVVRDALIRAAADGFARDGFDGARIDEISIAAGYAKGTVYNYFASKEELFGAVIEEAARTAARRYAEVPPAPTARARLHALASADVSVARDEPAFVKVLVREAMSFRPRTYGLIVTHLGPYIAAVDAVLAAGQAAGEVRADRPSPQLAILFVGLLSLYYVQHWGSDGAWPTMDEIPDLVTTAFWDGAAAPAAPARARHPRGPR